MWDHLPLTVCASAQVAATVKVAMPPYQAVIYNWVVQTGTLRNDPEAPITGSTRRPYATLNNKCMELRKVRAAICGHTLLTCALQHQRKNWQLHSIGAKLVVVKVILKQAP